MSAELTTTARIVQMSNEEYHARPEVSKSDLALFARAPYLYRWHKLDGAPKDSTDAMDVGSAAHLLVLEPDLFQDRYYVLPDGVRRDKRTAEYKGHLQAAGGKEVLRQSDMLKVYGISKALLADPAASRLLEKRGGCPGAANHTIEHAIFWTDEETGIELRCKPDDMRDDGVILDLKTSADAEPEAFSRKAFDFFYDVSVAQTSAGYEAVFGDKPAEYVLICVSTEPPHLISCFTTFELFDGLQSFHSVGHHRWRNLLRRFAKCERDDHWPGYQRGIEPMRVPAYELKRLEANVEGL
jgi:hypothetical protein